MAVIDLLTGFPGWSSDFDLLWRQEQSRQANGVTRVKDFGDPLWRATYTSRSLSPNELDYWRARLAALDNGVQQFYGRPTSRCYPIGYPNGTGLTAAGTISAVGDDTLSFTGSSQLQVGDYFQVGTTDLYQVVGTGASVTVRPYVWAGTAVGDTVTLVKPACVMTLVPGSISSTAELATGRGVVSFQAVESR